MGEMYKEFSAKSVDEAITEASIKLGMTSDKMKYEVVDKGSNGFLGIGSRPAIIRVFLGEEKKSNPEEIKITPAKNEIKEEKIQKPEFTIEEEETVKEKKEDIDPDVIAKRAVQFLVDVTSKMGIEASIDASYDVEGQILELNMSGEDMGLLIGKRGQTLDSLQYLVSLVVNKNIDSYVRVNLDTENYRARRKETLENFAHNIAAKVKKTGKDITLEPMNPNERRVIHYALQNDAKIKTFSVGKDPYRKIIVSLVK